MLLGCWTSQRNHQKPLHSPQVMILCMLGRSCIGPYFFEENGITNCYCCALQLDDKHLLVPELRSQSVNGCSLHNVSQPPHFQIWWFCMASQFPELSMCDYFYGDTSSLGSMCKPHTLDELMDSIRQHITQMQRPVRKSGGQFLWTPTTMHTWQWT